MKQQGFTLIELMITVVIVAILARIIIPSYQTYVKSAKLNEAYNNLTSFRVQMEQSYQDNNNYGSSSCAVANPTGTYFTYSCSLANSGQSFTATATGNGTQGISGYTFTIASNGTRTTTAFPSATVPASCWLNNAGGC